VKLARRLEDLDVWKKGCRLACDVFKLAEEGSLARNFTLRDQVSRSALSVPSNIAEGFERDSKKGFVSFLRIAKGSCGELRTQLYIAARLGYIPQKRAAELVDKAKEISRMLAGLVQSLKTAPKK
jgi:four helix bundle protein